MCIARWGSSIVGLISSAVLALAMSGPALAEEGTTQPGRSFEERLSLLKDSVADHKRAKDADALLIDIRAVVSLHEQATADAKIRKASVKLVGGLTRGRIICSTVAVAALDGLGRMGDPEGARYVESRLKRMPNNAKATTVMRAAIGAAKLLCDDSFVNPLLKIVKDSKNFTLAAQAVETLGKFRHCKRKRVKILKTLVDTTAKDRPGLKGRSKDPIPNDQYRHTGELARNRWQALSRVLPAALFELTRNESMKGASADWWIDAVTNNKRNLSALFCDDEE